MRQISSLLLLALLSASALMAQTGFRRGNPTTTYPRSEFYIVDSDDSSPWTPTYNFVDTTYGTWMRMTNWPDNDNSCDTVPITYDSIYFPYYEQNIWILQPPHAVSYDSGPKFEVPGCFVSTNGTICLNGPDSSAVNIAMPSPLIAKDLIAPLWADWELRAAGDSSKVFARVTSDSFYISFYNLGLKGTNGLVRATFQVAFATSDSSITFTYKSFDGSFAGVSAEALIQQVATIGMTDGVDGFAAIYLHKGFYFASDTIAKYNLPLHNHLVIRFLRMNADAFEITDISMPPTDRYELNSGQFSPACKLLNESDSTIRLFVATAITNVTTGVPLYGQYDSVDVSQGVIATYTAPLATGLSCGSYKVTFTITYRNNVSDEWPGNNTFTRYFVILSPQAAPFREEFDEGMNLCAWSNAGADVRSIAGDAAHTVFRIADAPIATGLGPKALVMNRLDANGNPYPVEVGGDTLTSAPIDLSHATNVYLWFHYQRGLASDSTQAGIFDRLHAGPELAVPGARGGLAQVGDSLVVEGLESAGSEWNPAESAWQTIGVIPGGFDTKLQTFRILLGGTFLHNHFRVRFRMKARNAESPQLYFEDADNYAIDAVHVEPWQTERTDLEPVDLDLGNGNNTHVPRALAAGMVPMVTIQNNGDFVKLGVCQLHLAIRDALNRLVYDETSLISFPGANTDSVYAMPPWNIEGSQGPYFTAYVTLFNNFYEYYTPNDTNIFYETINVDNSYAIDDGAPDTVSGNVQPDSNFFFDFHSVMPDGNDTLRGIEFYFPGSGSASNWTITIVGNSDSATRTVSITPSVKGWFSASFAPYVMLADSTYRMHFALNSGPNASGDASNGLVYYTYVDSTTPANNQYGFLHPDVLGLFHNSRRVSYLLPAPAIADAGGYLLPMFRLITTGTETFLPVTLVAISAQRMADGAGLIRWEMAQQDGPNSFIVERQDDGIMVGTVPVVPSINDATYTIVDPTAPQPATIYRLIVQMQNGTQTSLGEVQLAPWNGAGFQLAVYPNPASGEITISGASVMQSIEIFDPLGRIILSAQPNANIATLELPDLSAGAYWIIAKSDGAIARKRIAILR